MIMKDYVRGLPYTLYRIKLPNGFDIEVCASQYDSGKVVVSHYVSLSIKNLDLKSLKFLDKFSEFIKLKKVVK